MLAGAAPAGGTTSDLCACLRWRSLTIRRRPDFMNARLWNAASSAGAGGGVVWMTYLAPAQAFDRLLRAAVRLVSALSGTFWSAYFAARSSAACARTRRVCTIDG